jgi:hypothetical protein
MLFVFSSLIVAMALGLGAHAYYGTEELINHAWVVEVTYSIVGAGFAVEALCWARCTLCRRSKLAHRKSSYLICGQWTCNDY